MARGPRLHLKRIQAPKNWHLSKMKGNFAPKQAAGAHKKNEAVPLTVLLRNLMGYAKTAKEANLILEQGHILVNGKVRTDGHFGVGLMDIVHIPTLNLTFRLILNSRGQWTMVSPSYNEKVFSRPLERPLPELTQTSTTEPSTTTKKPKSAFDKKSKNSDNFSTTNDFSVLNVKNQIKKTSSKSSANKNKEGSTGKEGKTVKSCLIPCKVRRKRVGDKKVVGINRAGKTPSEKAIPYCSTECGRTIRFIDTNIKAGDTIMLKVVSTPINTQKKYQKYNYKIEQEVVKHIKFEEGKLGYIVRGKNSGRVGRVKFVEKHVKNSDVIYMEDEIGNKFVTKKENVFIIGDKHSEIGLGTDRGVRMGLEDRIKLNMQRAEAKEE